MAPIAVVSGNGRKRRGPHGRRIPAPSAAHRRWQGCVFFIRKLPLTRFQCVWLVLFLVGGGSAFWAQQTGRLGPAEAAFFARFHAEARQAGLTIQNVMVTGRRQTSSDALLEALGAQRGSGILELDLDQAKARLEVLPWVKSVRVTRQLPRTVHVALTERVPVAIWQNQGVFQLVDAEGAEITKQGLQDYSALPLVVGERAARHLRQLLNFYAIDNGIVPRIKAAIWVGDRRWNVLFETGVTVMLPQDGAADAWRAFVALEQAHQILSRKIETVDLRLADRLVIRATPEGFFETLLDDGQRT